MQHCSWRIPSPVQGLWQVPFSLFFYSCVYLLNKTPRHFSLLMAVQAIWNASIICNYFPGDCPPYLQSVAAMYSFSFVFSCIVSFCLCITSHFYVLFPKGRCFPSQQSPWKDEKTTKKTASFGSLSKIQIINASVYMSMWVVLYACGLYSLKSAVWQAPQPL